MIIEAPAARSSAGPQGSGHDPGGTGNARELRPDRRPPQGVALLGRLRYAQGGQRPGPCVPHPRGPHPRRPGLPRPAVSSPGGLPQPARDGVARGRLVTASAGCNSRASGIPPRGAASGDRASTRRDCSVALPEPWAGSSSGSSCSTGPGNGAVQRGTAACFQADERQVALVLNWAHSRAQAVP